MRSFVIVVILGFLATIAVAGKFKIKTEGKDRLWVLMKEVPSNWRGGGVGESIAISPIKTAICQLTGITIWELYLDCSL